MSVRLVDQKVYEAAFQLVDTLDAAQALNLGMIAHLVDGWAFFESLQSFGELMGQRDIVKVMAALERLKRIGAIRVEYSRGFRIRWEYVIDGEPEGIPELVA